MQAWDNGSQPKPKLDPAMKAYFAGHPTKSNKVPTVTEKRAVLDAFFSGAQARLSLTDSQGTYRHEFLCTGKRVLLDDATIIRNTGDHECPSYTLSAAFCFPELIARHPAMLKVVKTVLMALSARGYDAAAIDAMIDRHAPLPDFLQIVQPN